ncbi:hypothetical protein [Photobacterium satsumensis]|uniref:hypothetical protein n=1 Tax=Photobacterium satsumensis TaxID=2910239 RepID=UPI003D13A530
MINLNDEKKVRINISISKRALNTLQENIPEKKRSAFVEFLINHYCKYEAGNFNRFYFSKETAEIINRDENQADDKRLHDLISELAGKVDELKEHQEYREAELAKLKHEVEALQDG